MKICQDSDDEIPVTWYFCHEDAPPFPYYHRFASGNWATTRTGWDGPGEVEGAPRPWKNGQGPELAIGDHFCGTEEQFRDGALDADRKICTDSDGWSSCCPDPREYWCCDFDPCPELTPFPVSITVTRVPPYPWDVVFPLPLWILTVYRQDVGPPFAFMLLGLDPNPPHGLAYVMLIECYGKIWGGTAGGINVGGIVAASAEPFGIRFLRARPFNFMYPFPPSDWEVTIIIGTDPPYPPFPEFLTMLPTGYFPEDYWPPHYL